MLELLSLYTVPHLVSRREYCIDAFQHSRSPCACGPTVSPETKARGEQWLRALIRGNKEHKNLHETLSSKPRYFLPQSTLVP